MSLLFQGQGSLQDGDRVAMFDTYFLQQGRQIIRSILDVSWRMRDRSVRAKLGLKGVALGVCQ